jgi:3-oxoacyl-[acyl-carrier protein] reductase
MDLELKGKNALVTGGSRGIGKCVAQTLVNEGAEVGICARNGEEVKAAVDSLSSGGSKVIGAVADVGDGYSYKAWITSAIEDLGGLDLFVANVSAGGGNNTEEGWKANFEVDVLGTVRGIETVTPALSDSKGSVVIISTTTAIENGPGAGAYGAMKAALINLSSAKAQELAPQGVNCNVVSPGPIYIEGGPWNFIKDNMEDFYKATLSAIPAGRMGAAQDVANAVVFLGSPAASYITGTNVVIDGGFTKGVHF